MFIYFPFSTLTICTSLQHCVYIQNMTFVMSLLFWNFCVCNVYCSFLLFIIYLTCFGNVNIYVSHANKALKLNLERKKRRESKKKRK